MDEGVFVVCQSNLTTKGNQFKEGNHRYSHRYFGCGCISICDYVFSKTNIKEYFRKEGKMGFIIAVLVVVILVIVVTRLI